MFARVKLWFKSKWTNLRNHPAFRMVMATTIAALMGAAVYFAIISAFAIFASVVKTALLLGIVTVVIFILLFVFRIRGSSQLYPTAESFMVYTSRVLASITVFLCLLPIIFPASVVIVAWEMAKAIVRVV